MNLRKKVTSIVATSAILLGMTAGAVVAQPVDDDDDQTYLNMICPATNEITVTVGNDFTVDASDGFSGDIAGIPFYDSDVQTDNFTVVMDLSCNWSTDFNVGAEIHPFVHDGVATVAPGTRTTFGGGHLYLFGGSGTYVGPSVTPLGLPITGTPDVESEVFPTVISTSGPMIQEGSFWGLWDLAAPGVTTATWDGQLRFLPVNLADGRYEADLVVTLSVD